MTAISLTVHGSESKSFGSGLYQTIGTYTRTSEPMLGEHFIYNLCDV